MRIILFIIIWLSCATLLFANGGPLDVGEINRTGNIELIKKQNISLEEESLSIKIDGDYAYVNVQYKLKNHGDADTVSYGFPIDQDCDDTEYISEKSDDSLMQFKIEDNFGFLKTFKYVPKTMSEIEEYPADKKSDSKSIRHWFITGLSFKKGEEKKVKVNYKVKSRFSDMIFSKSFRPEFSDRSFSYILKPSQNWGNGIVKKLTIMIDASALIKNKGEIKTILPTGFKNQKSVYSKELTDVNLQNAEDIKVVYDNTAMAFSKYIMKARIPDKYILSVKSSSFLRPDKGSKFDYSPKNAFDNDPNTVWAEGVKGPGIGEWIEFDLDDIVVSAIGIVSGYTKSHSLFYANNRPNEVQFNIEWNRHVAFAEDEEKVFTESFQPPEYDEAIKVAPAPFINWLVDYGEGHGSIRKIRLTITGVIPGQKFDDTCISEIYILGFRE